MKETITFLNESYVDDNGVYRWKSNNAVPFDDMLESVGIDSDTRKKCEIARDKDTDRFLSDYRRTMENHEYSEEELFEMKVTFGSGTEIVNVVTGKKTIL